MRLSLMALLRALFAPLLPLALAQMQFWDTPASEMGVAEPGDGGGRSRGNDRSDESTDDVGDGHDDDRQADDEGDGDADARRGRQSTGDDEDDQDDDPLNALGGDDDDDEDGREVTPERFKKVLKAKRRLERTLKKNGTKLGRVRDLEKSGVSLDDLVHSHRQLSAFQAQIEKNPQLRALLGADEDQDDRTTTRRSGGGKRETKLPFDPNTPAGKFFQDWYEASQQTIDDLRKELSEIREQTTGIRNERTQERTQATVNEWRTAADAATKKLPDGIRELFHHTVGLEMRRVIRGELKATPQQIIDLHLKKLKIKGSIDPKDSSRASDAARESIARRNTTQPRRPAGHGSPGPAKERTIPRMRDFNRGLRQKWGGAS